MNRLRFKSFLFSFTLHLVAAAFCFIKQQPQITTVSSIQLDLSHDSGLVYNQTSLPKEPNSANINTKNKQESQIKPFDSVIDKFDKNKKQQTSDSITASGTIQNQNAGSSYATNQSSKYALQIIQVLNKLKIYPQEAIDREIEGRVLIEVLIDLQGHIKQSIILEKSTFDVLNEAALRTIKKISLFPAPPPELKTESGEIKLTIPLQYKIERQ